MIINLISYSLDQGHYNFTLKEIEKNLLDLNQDGKKYIIYYSDIFYSGSLRNKEEYKIQLSVSIKHKLIGYAAEEYEIIIIGYDKHTNTFTLFKYDQYFETNTKQSLFISKSTILEAKKEGFSKFFYKKRDSFNNRRNDYRSISFSCNAFLFPLILKYYPKIFDRDFEKNFSDKIKRYNFPYSKDDLLLSLYLYFKERNTKNIDKKDPELEEVSRLCKLRFKLLGFNPIDKFFPSKYAKKFRNINGIYTKIQNFKFTDPNEEGGYPGGAHDAQDKIWKSYLKNGKINKTKIKKDANHLIDKIKSENILVLIGTKKIEKLNVNEEENSQILLDNNFIPEILDFKIDKKYKNRIINPDNFSDKIDALNQIDKSNELHEKIINSLAKIFERKKMPIKKTSHIDFYSFSKQKGYLFEVKTFNKSNFNQQIRHGIIQLKEYYFAYANYWKIIPSDTSLYLLVDSDPKNYINDIQLKFLKSQNIQLCWIKKDQVVNLENLRLF